ncbi:enoyl-CoA hydratase/isomerase family protein [Brucella tritici]|uniref:Enoyl-CoA hydratase/isomerase family protein n=1 Tax=Brucella tritici TaxID=94626 RepID=A0A7V7VU96_9HYPH|nr:enoyl-CoA hydratase/isomerase family protein [Brucella tritici]
MPDTSIGFFTDTGQYAGLYKTCEYEHLKNWQKPGAEPRA